VRRSIKNEEWTCLYSIVLRRIRETSLQVF
jgi:hypothetical protein